ncbi:MAG: phytanoyl-CoA dioxygenase family protein [Gammaproteobacteria bacterium]|nr:phytanoyl-CoA dioxygenase family protein [Gammaproteobacteria bacterium]
MARAGPSRPDRNAAIVELGLEPYVLDLELNGYAVVPPSVTGVTDAEIDTLTRLLLDKSEELVGCQFTVEDGPTSELDYGDHKGVIERMSGAEPSQFQLMQLCTFDRAFRDLAVNPVAVALMRHMIGHRATRFSSHNCFIKWAGDGYGDSLGLHCDQGGVPQPWGRVALNANCNWCLTEYSPDSGPLACVPGSHLRASHPVQPGAAREAIPVECPRGSLIAFHGQLWHGAYPRTAPGLRITISNFYRHAAIQPQDDIPNHFPRELAEDCDDPDTFKQLAGFGLPYQAQALPVPKARREP